MKPVSHAPTWAALARDLLASLGIRHVATAYWPDRWSYLLVEPSVWPDPPNRTVPFAGFRLLLQFEPAGWRLELHDAEPMPGDAPLWSREHVERPHWSVEPARAGADALRAALADLAMRIGERTAA